MLSTSRLRNVLLSPLLLTVLLIPGFSTASCEEQPVGRTGSTVSPCNFPDLPASLSFLLPLPYGLTEKQPSERTAVEVVEQVWFLNMKQRVCLGNVRIGSWHLALNCISNLAIRMGVLSINAL